MVLPFGHVDINNYVFIKRGSNKVLQKYGLIGKITKIKNTNPIEITIPNHNLIDLQKIYIYKSNCIPNIDNIYNSVKVIDKDTISIDNKIELSNEGDNGFIYSLNTIKYNKYNIKFNKNNKISINLEGEKKDSNIELPNLYIFNNININNDKEKWETIIKSIIPKIDDIVGLEYPYIKNCKTIKDINNILKKYDLNYNNIYINHIKILNNGLNKKLKDIEKNYKEIKLLEKKK